MRYEGQDAAMRCPAGGIDTESDCENDPTGAGEGTPTSREDYTGEKCGQVRAILNPGSFAA